MAQNRHLSTRKIFALTYRHHNKRWSVGRSYYRLTSNAIKTSRHSNGDNDGTWRVEWGEEGGKLIPFVETFYYILHYFKLYFFLKNTHFMLIFLYLFCCAFLKEILWCFVSRFSDKNQSICQYWIWIVQRFQGLSISILFRIFWSLKQFQQFRISTWRNSKIFRSAWSLKQNPFSKVLPLNRHQIFVLFSSKFNFR